MAEEYGQYPWLFKGAYAIYTGTTKLKSIPGEFEATARVEVGDIDSANKRVKIHACSSGFQHLWRLKKKLGENKVADWVQIGERIILSDEAILDGEYEGVIRVEGLGVRKCIVQQYSEGLNTTVVFWDNEFNWPLKYILIFRHKSEGSLSILNDVESIIKDTLGDTLNFMAANSMTEYELKKLERSIEDLKNLLMKSKSEALRERSLILYLKET